MFVTNKHVGQRFDIAGSLEVVVLELANDHVKLGIRSLDPKSAPTPPVASNGLGSPVYYHSNRGPAMLVVSAAAGRQFRINDSVILSIEGFSADQVQLKADSIEHRPPTTARNRSENRSSACRSLSP